MMGGKFFFVNDVLPCDMMVEILVRVPPRGLSSINSVCKNWRDSLRDQYIRKLQILSWRRSNTSFLLHCNRILPYDFYPRTIQVSKNPAGLDSFQAVLDDKWFTRLDQYSIVGVYDGIICIKYRNMHEMLPRLLLLNPLTKRMHSVVLPSSVPSRRM